MARNKDDELLLKFLYGTGARVSEACNLKIEDLIIEKLDGKVRGKIINGKGGKDRDFYIPIDLSLEFETLLKKRKAENIESEYLFLN